MSRRRSWPAARLSAMVATLAVVAGAAACGGSGGPQSNGTGPSSATGGVTIATGSAAPQTTSACDGTRRDRTVAYAQHAGTPVNRTSLDLYLPARPRCAPVFVFVHGGGYCCGDKENDIVGPAAWLTRNGFIVASVNYRLTQGRGAVTFPVFDQDVVDALSWLRTHIGAWGGDGTRLVLAGHSTGAEMAALIGSDPALLAHGGLDTSSLRCVLVLDAAVLDVGGLMRAGGAISLYNKAFGTDPNGWAAESATVQAQAGHVVARWLVALRPGEKPLKLQQQQTFVATLRHTGANVTTVDASSIGHAHVIDDIGRSGDRLMTVPVAQFLAGCVS